MTVIAALQTARRSHAVELILGQQQTLSTGRRARWSGIIDGFSQQYGLVAVEQPRALVDGGHT